MNKSQTYGRLLGPPPRLLSESMQEVIDFKAVRFSEPAEVPGQILALSPEQPAALSLPSTPESPVDVSDRAKLQARVVGPYFTDLLS